MRVVHLNTNSRWGGGENQILHLLRGTRGPEFQPLLLARKRSPLFAKAAAEGLEAQPFDPLSRLGPLSMGRLAGILREAGADILHLHDGDAVSLGLPAALTNRRLRVVAHRRIASPMRRNPLTRWKYSVKRIAAYVAVSESAKAPLVEFGIPQEKIRLIPSGVDLERIRPPEDRNGLRRELGLEEGTWIGTVTALNPKKNLQTFLRAAARIARELPGARFLVVGEGSERGALEDLARSLLLGRERLRFAAYQEEAWRFAAALDVFVFCSLLEGSPGALKEAMALGVPVVAGNSPGTSEIVADGTGVLVPAAEPDVYADAILHVLGHAPWAREMAARGAERVRSRFSMHQMIERTAALDRELCGA